MRRVVTGIVGGKSVIVSDEEMKPQTLVSLPGHRLVELWGTPADLPTPSHEHFQPSGGYPPKPGESQFLVVTFPPSSVYAAPDFDRAAVAKERQRLRPGFVDDPAHPGMHATMSVDYAVILDGSIVLELEDGVRTQLNCGDVVVQCGAIHGWRTSDSPATLAIVLIGAGSD